MKIKSGDIIEFAGISWEEPAWEFDHPVLIIKPCLRFSTEGESLEQLFEDLAIDICMQEPQNYDEEISDC